jgi:hypothetical protein
MLVPGSRIFYTISQWKALPGEQVVSRKENNNKSFLDFKKGVDQRLNEQNKQLDHRLRKINERVLITVDPTRD